MSNIEKLPHSNALNFKEAMKDMHFDPSGANSASAKLLSPDMLDTKLRKSGIDPNSINMSTPTQLPSPNRTSRVPDSEPHIDPTPVKPLSSEDWDRIERNGGKVA